MKFPFTLSRQFWFAVFGIALLLALGWVASTSGPLAPTKVTLTQVAAGEIKPALFGIGTVEARRAYFIGPTAAGRVGRVLADVGDTVSAGQLLAEMDPVDLDARVSAAVAAAARARSAVTTAQAQVADATSRRELADSEARRYVELGAAGLRQRQRRGWKSAATAVGGGPTCRRRIRSDECPARPDPAGCRTHGGGAATGEFSSAGARGWRGDIAGCRTRLHGRCRAGRCSNWWTPAACG